MDQIQNSLLTMAAAKGPRETGKASQTGGREEKDGFRKLMAQQDRPEVHSDMPRQESVTDQPAPEADTDLQTLEQQMALAAMAVLKAPVQMAESVELMPEQTAPALTLMGQKGEQPQLQQTLPEMAEQTQAPVEAEVPETLLQQQKAPVTRFDDFRSLEQTARQTVQSPAETVSAEKPETQVEPEVLEAAQAGEQPVFRNVETVPVKVGDVPAEEPSTPVEQQLGDRLSQALRKGESRVEVQLEPRALGKVRVQLTMHQDGSLHVVLQAEKPATQALLDRGAGELQGLLGRDSRQNVVVETDHGREDQAPMFHDQEQNRDQGHQDRQDHQEHRQDRQREQNDSFFQQLRLGLIPAASM